MATTRTMWILGVLDFCPATTRNSLRNETNEAQDVAPLLLLLGLHWEKIV